MNIKKSILIVDLSTSGNTSGARIVPLTNYFIRRSYKVSLLINQITKKTYLYSLGLKSSGARLITFPLSKNFSKGKIAVGFEYFKRVVLSPFVKVKGNIDIIYSLTGIICDVFLGYLLKKKTGKIWVANVDNIEDPPSKKHGPYIINFFSYLLFRLSIFLLRSADLVFITTPLDEVKDTLINGGIKEKKIILSNNGIYYDSIKRLRVNASKSSGASYLGRIHSGKGVFDLVEIWSKVTEKLPSAGKLTIIGSGDKITIDKINRLIKKLRLEKKVILTGFIKKENDKYLLMKKSLVFLYPSYYDANPISTIEALACGLPVIAYKLPIFKKHYPLIQTAGLGNKEEFVKKTIELFKNDSKRKNLSLKGLELAAQFSWPEIFKKQEKEISKLFRL